MKNNERISSSISHFRPTRGKVKNVCILYIFPIKFEGVDIVE